MVVDAVLQFVALLRHRERDPVSLISGTHRAVVAPRPSVRVDVTLVEAVEPCSFFAASRSQGFELASDRVLIRRKFPKESQKSFFTWTRPRVEGRLGAAGHRKSADERVEAIIRVQR